VKEEKEVEMNEYRGIKEVNDAGMEEFECEIFSTLALLW